MRKFIYGIGIVIGLSLVIHAGTLDRRSVIGPANSRNTNVTIAAGGTGIRNCITRLITASDNLTTVRVLNGATTSYAVLVATNTIASHINSDPGEAFCGPANTAMYINISTAGTVSWTTYDIDYQGYTY